MHSKARLAATLVVLTTGALAAAASLAAQAVITSDSEAALARRSSADVALALRSVARPSRVVEMVRTSPPAPSPHANVRLRGDPEPTLSRRAMVGTLTGQVVTAGTRRPLAGAQVYVPGSSIGGLTNANGRYLLANVPDGPVTVRVELIGYSAAERQVTITPGATTTADFELTEVALALDEIVVTGTAGQARRREVGNTIAQIRPTEVPEPVANVENLLQARAPGLWVSQGSGGSGQGARIRLRGNVSMAMSNQPLIYVDGVRIKSEPYPAASVPGAGSGPQDRGSPLSDINPADIDRIEIIKGAAATTLYGTEAAAGVIQIFTKKGFTGRPTWTAQIDQGYNYFRPWGPDWEPYMWHKPALRNGWRQRYSVSVGGGAEQLGYFVSFARDDNEGAIQTDWEKRTSLRGNANFRPSQNMMIEFNSSITSQDVANTRQGNTGTSSVMVLNQQYWGPQSRTPETLFEILKRNPKRSLNRFITGLTASYTPRPDFTNRVTVGYDVADWRGTLLIPYGWRNPGQELGQIARQINQTILKSFDYVSSLRVSVAPELRSTFSVGAQLVENKEENVWTVGNEFPGPGEFTVTSTARRDGGQDLLRVITGGFFAQSLLDYKDRYFLTLGLRVDGNSAFGQSFGLQPYPKVSVSYVISDEGFWPEGLGEMKLRAAYGHAGRAPGAFDAVRTWNPIGFGPTRPALLPANLGNADMGPERTAEMELGFDGAFLGGRARVEYTYYHRSTTDALFRVRAAPSDGNWNAQLQNVGELASWGHEIALNATVLDRSALAWDLGLGVSTNGSKVVSLGGSPRFSVGDQAWVEEGQPAPVVRGNMIVNFWEKAQPIVVDDTIYGPHYPTLSLSPSTSFTFLNGIVLSARGEYHGGWFLNHGQESPLLSRNLDWPPCYPAYKKRDEGKLDEIYAWEWGKCLRGYPRRYIHPGDFFEMRDITLSVPLSQFFPSLGQASLSLSSRNLFYITKKEIMVGHPEANTQTGTGNSSLTRSITEQLPPQSTFVASLRVVF